jgi:hypothetical protein
LEVLAETTSVALAWRTLATTTLVDGVVSLAAAFTITALVARITSHTLGHTPAPTERQTDQEVADGRLSLPE